jgi:hypothetical protein
MSGPLPISATERAAVQWTRHLSAVLVERTNQQGARQGRERASVALFCATSLIGAVGRGYRDVPREVVTVAVSGVAAVDRRRATAAAIRFTAGRGAA